MKTIINDIFFNLRMGFGIKLFGLKKSSGYYSRTKDALVGLKKNGYCRLEKYYTNEEINDLLNECLGILDKSEEIFLKDKHIKDSLERVDGEIKIKHIHTISNISNLCKCFQIYSNVGKYFQIFSYIFKYIHIISFCKWWRRGESNPRPQQPKMESFTGIFC